MSVSPFPNTPAADGVVTGLHGRRTHYSTDFAALARNRFAMARSATGMTAAEFAQALSTLLSGRTIEAAHVAAWETRTPPPGDVLVAAGALAPGARTHLGVRSHKFIAAHIGHEAAQRLAAAPGMQSVTGYLGKTACAVSPIAGVGERCTLTVWPWGTVIIHLLEDVDAADVTTLALWRYRSYPQNLAWAGEYLSGLVGEPITASYILSLYWVYATPWMGATLDTGLRLVCSPRVLVDHHTAADDPAAVQVSGERIEAELLAAGYAPPEMRAFGALGVSSAWASWSGVVYHPLDAARALPEADLVGFEIGLQAVWAYTAHIAEQVENDVDPQVCPRYGYGFLRAVRSLLLSPRPQETGQHQQLREALVSTSGLAGQLNLAMDALREAGR